MEASSGEEVGDSAGLEEVPAGDGEAVELRYVMWDINQFPAYEECAANFNGCQPQHHRQRLSNFGWGDYWTNLQTEMVAGGAPDVFTNHLAKYPEFVSQRAKSSTYKPWVDRRRC